MQAKILAALCNDLLSTAPVRSEIDRREAADQIIAGQGGEGGVMPMRSADERSERQTLIEARQVVLRLSGGSDNLAALTGLQFCLPAIILEP